MLTSSGLEGVCVEEGQADGKTGAEAGRAGHTRRAHAQTRHTHTRTHRRTDGEILMGGSSVWRECAGVCLGEENSPCPLPQRVEARRRSRQAGRQAGMAGKAGKAQSNL